MGHKDGKLVIPNPALKDPKANEMIRAWVAQKSLHCSVRLGVWKDPAAWGLLLADIVRHVANAHSESEGRDKAQTIQKIRQGFNAEMDKPSNKPKASGKDNGIGRQDGELEIPNAALADPKSSEMIRAWVAQEGTHCSLRVGVWKDPAPWGMLLADLVRNVANAHEESEGRDSLKTIQRIREGFNVEMDSPTDEPKGKFVKP
jgi:hypothetical protein